MLLSAHCTFWKEFTSRDRNSKMTDVISGIKIPDSKIAREAAELVRQHEI